MIVHLRQGDAEAGKVAEDGAADDREREGGAEDHGSRHQEQNRGDEFHDARTDSAPGLGAQLAKDIDGLAGSGEFEKQSLQQDGGNDEAERPTDGDNIVCFGRVLMEIKVYDL